MNVLEVFLRDVLDFIWLDFSGDFEMIKKAPEEKCHRQLKLQTLRFHKRLLSFKKLYIVYPSLWL